MFTVFGMSASGNCYKVKLMLEQLRVGYRWEEVDALNGATRTPKFIAMNGNGRVPVLEIEPGCYQGSALFHRADPVRRSRGLTQGLQT